MLLLLWNANPRQAVLPQMYYQPVPLVYDDTDEDFLLVWFMFMTRYYGKVDE